MKTLKDKFLFLLVLVLMLQLMSCSDDDNNPVEPPQYTYIVSQTKIDTKYQAELLLLAGFAGLQIAPQHNVDVYKIEYRSVGKGTAPVTCSGIICVPQGIETKRGVISWQHATHISNKESPSQNVDPTSTIATSEPAMTASLGYVAVSNDYLGFGSTASKNMAQSYHIYSQTTADWLCFMQAVEEFIEINSISTSKDMWIMGYSQGGYNATAAMKRWETENHNFFNLKEVYSGDGAYSISTLADIIFQDNDYPAVYLSPLFLMAYNYYYNLGINNADIYKSPYADMIDELYDVNGTLKPANVIPNQLNAFFTDKFIDEIRNKTGEFYYKLAENNLTNFIPRNKLYIFHSNGDEIIPVETAEAAFNYYSASNNVELVKSANAAGHSDTYLEFVNFIVRQLK